MQTCWQDIRYALRQLRRSPSFALTVVLTLALGVGANATVFSVLNALLLRPLPVPDARQVVSLNRFGSGEYALTPTPTQSYPDYRDVRESNRTFSALAAYAIKRGGVGIAGAVQQSWFSEVSENYFDTLGIQPGLGRFFHPSDVHGPNSSPYAVLSYAYWQHQFHGDPHVVGQVIELNRHPFMVLGVAPKSFGGVELFFTTDFWIPMLNQQQVDGYSYLDERSNYEIWILGRLKPGVTPAQAEADLGAIGRQLAGRYPEDEGLRFHLSRPGLLGDMLSRPLRAFLYGVMALAGLVLLAACANLGSLFAARASDRGRELALRLAVGARRADLVRQLVTEALVVSVLGGALGLGLADVVMRVLTDWRPSPEYPIQVTITPDARVLALALVLTLASGLFFGLVPTGEMWRSNAYSIIKGGPAAQGGSAAVTGRRRLTRLTLRDGLLVLQIILCSVLVTASFVAVRGMVRSLHASFGFRPQGAMLASFDLQMSGHSNAQSVAFQYRALDDIAAMPGVTAVGFSNKIPLSLSSAETDVYPVGTTDLRSSKAIAHPNYFDVSPGYLSAAGTRLMAGRDFTWHDDKQAPLVAIINQTFARKVFGGNLSGSGTGPGGPGSDAVGRYFTRDGSPMEVIGVVEDGKYNALTEEPIPALFLSAAQDSDSDTTLVVRSQAGEAATAAMIHNTLLKLDPNLPVSIAAWPQAMGMALLPSEAATVALGVLGVLAAMLAVTGIFGMASYAVSKRIRELGLRVALGASHRQVLTAALGRPARLLTTGSLAGLLLGALLSRLLAHVVYGATSQDPAVLGGVVASMALFALLATWLPARRALKVDPASLLREE
jgi:predicted permease